MLTGCSGPCQVGGWRYWSTIFCASATPSAALLTAGPALWVAAVVGVCSSLQAATEKAVRTVRPASTTRVLKRAMGSTPRGKSGKAREPAVTGEMAQRHGGDQRPAVEHLLRPAGVAQV